MEQNAEIPFAKAISKFSDNVGHFEGCKLATLKRHQFEVFSLGVLFLADEEKIN